MDTKTIDQRLREKADEKLRKKLDDAFRRLLNEIECRSTMDRIKISIITPDNKVDQNGIFTTVEAYNTEVLTDIKKAAFEKLKVKYQEAEVREFMQKVENLDGQVQELYGMVE